MGLDVNALHGVHQHQSAVAEPRCRGNLAAEIHVTRRVDQVDVVDIVETQSYRGALHGDGPPLFLVEVVHESETPGLLRMDQAICGRRDEVVGQGGFAVIDMSQYAYVSDVGALYISHGSRILVGFIGFDGG